MEADFSRGFSSERAGGVSGSSAPPLTTGLSRQGRCRSLTDRQRRRPGAGSAWKGDCRPDGASCDSFGDPSSSAAGLSQARAPRPGQECRKKPNAAGGEKPFPCVPLPKNSPPPASINPGSPPPFPRSTGRRSPHLGCPPPPPRESGVCLSSLSAVSTDRAPLSAARNDPRSQDPSGDGSTRASWAAAASAAGCSRRRSCAVAVKWWKQRVRS